MGIPNELSSDVATALLARKDPQAQAGTPALIEIVRNFHSAMRDLKSEERRRRRRFHKSSAAQQGQSSGRAASGSN